MNIVAVKEGSGLRIVESSEPIPEGKVLQLTSVPVVPPDAANEFSHLGLRAFFETTDDTDVNWEEYFDTK